jgi:hypothetical protein
MHKKSKQERIDAILEELKTCQPFEVEVKMELINQIRCEGEVRT